MSLVSLLFPVVFGLSCSSDLECSTANEGLLNFKSSAYLCVNNSCRLVVSPGKPCKTSSDCSEFHWASKKTPPVSKSYLDSLCSPDFCTIASACAADYSKLLKNDTNDFIYGFACCGGAYADSSCNFTSQLQTCSPETTCTLSADNTASCVSNNEKSGQWIGIVMAIVGAAFSNIGLNLQKLALQQQKEILKSSACSDISDCLDLKTLIQRPLWLFGLFVFVLSNFFNFIALKFASQSLVAPLGSISLVVNVVAAPLLNKEKFSWKDIVGISFIVGGSSMTVVFAGTVTEDYTICVLLELFQKIAAIVFLVAVMVLIFLLFLFIRVIETNIDCKSASDLESISQGKKFSALEYQSSQRTGSDATLSQYQATPDNRDPPQLFPFHEKSQPNSLATTPKPSGILRPILKRKFSEQSFSVRVLLPLSYASLGGLMATLTTLFAKSTIYLITGSFQGDNQFLNAFSWIITAVTIITAISQVYWINMGLQRYDALLQIPVFYCIWTLFDVVGGGVYFDEFKGFSSKQYGLFFLSIGVIFLGVFLLADRLRKQHDNK